MPNGHPHPPLLPPPGPFNGGDIIEANITEIAPRPYTAPDGERKVIRRYVKAVKLLNLPRAQWELSAIKAVEDFAGYMTPERTAAFLLHSSMLELEHLKNDCEECRKIAKDTGVPMEERLTAVKRLTEYTDCYRTLLPEVIRLSEKAQKNGKKGQTPRMNLPPMVVSGNVQINAGGAPSPASPAPAPGGNPPGAPPHLPPA